MTGPVPAMPSDPGLPGARGLLGADGMRFVTGFLVDRGWAVEEARPVQAIYRPGRSLVVRYRVAAGGAGGRRAFSICAEVRRRPRKIRPVPGGFGERHGIPDPVEPRDGAVVWGFPYDPALDGVEDAAPAATPGGVPVSVPSPVPAGSPVGDVVRQGRSIGEGTADRGGHRRPPSRRTSDPAGAAGGTPGPRRAPFPRAAWSIPSTAPGQRELPAVADPDRGPPRRDGRRGGNGGPRVPGAAPHPCRSGRAGRGPRGPAPTGCGSGRRAPAGRDRDARPAGPRPPLGRPWGPLRGTDLRRRRVRARSDRPGRCRPGGSGPGCGELLRAPAGPRPGGPICLRPAGGVPESDPARLHPRVGRSATGHSVAGGPVHSPPCRRGLL